MHSYIQVSVLKRNHYGIISVNSDQSGHKTRSLNPITAQGMQIEDALICIHLRFQAPQDSYFCCSGFWK